VSDLQLAVIDSGLHHRGVFAGQSPTFVLPIRGASIRPERFDVIVVPFHTDQVFLAERRKELEKFVEAGGSLLVLGACDLANSDWIPFCRWMSEYTYETTINKDSSAAVKIFRGLVDKDLKFHSKYHAHGALISLRPETTEIVATGEKNRAVMLLTRMPSGGASVVTTLDPDHHSSPTVAGPGKMTTEPARQKALQLLNNLLTFSKDIARSRARRLGWRIPNPQKVFLSHKSKNKDLVREFNAALVQLGYETWLDEEVLPAGRELERALLRGMQESCGAVFFITPDFIDEGWLAKEVEYAIAEKNNRGDGFALVTMVFQDEAGKKGGVPELLKNRFVYKEPKSNVEALKEIVRALPIRPGPMVWR